MLGRVCNSGPENRAKREWSLTRPKPDYAGTYENEAWGVIEVTVAGGDMTLTMGNLQAIAEPFVQPDSVRVELVPFQGWAALFQMGENGRPEAVTINGTRFARC